MTKPLKLVAANDTFAALLALGEVLAGNQALFVTAPEVNGLMPEVHGLPDAVDDSVGVIVESSGSTGVPKRIELSTDALLASANAAHARLGGPGQWLLALPINFVAGLNVLVRSLVAETAPVITNAALPFTPEGFARSASVMTGERRYTSLVPTQLERISRELPFNDFLAAQLRRFDAILVGGQATNPATLRALRTAGAKVVETYGMTETCGGCVYDGVPLDGVHISLDDDGAIEIAGPMLANNVAGAGSFSTNDRGEFDTDGRLHVLGRADRVIASGGIKVSLDRVEQFAATVVGADSTVPDYTAEVARRMGLDLREGARP